MNELDEKIINWKFACLNLASETISPDYDENVDFNDIINAAEKYYEFVTKGLELSKPNDESPF